MIRCDRCSGATQEKQITSKKDGKKYTILECTNGCKSGKYNYSFFPPKEEKAPVQATASNGQALNVLNQILQALLRIEKILANPEKVNVAASELEADQDVPF